MTTQQDNKTETRPAIRTRYAGPTNSRGARIIVTDKARRLIHDWDHALDVTENHAQAAQEFLDRHYNAIRYLDERVPNKIVIDGPGLYFDDDFYWTWRVAK